MAPRRGYRANRHSPPEPSHSSPIQDGRLCYRSNLPQQLGFHSRRRLDRCKRTRKRSKSLVGLQEIFLALSAARSEVGLEPSKLLAFERAQSVNISPFKPFVVVHDASPPAFAPRSLRRRSSAARMRVFTVPRGSFSLAAISDCVNPSK